MRSRILESALVRGDIAGLKPPAQFMEILRILRGESIQNETSEAGCSEVLFFFFILRLGWKTQSQSSLRQVQGRF
jgi:hypothetical protein